MVPLYFAAIGLYSFAVAKISVSNFSLQSENNRCWVGDNRNTNWSLLVGILWFCISFVCQNFLFLNGVQDSTCDGILFCQVLKFISFRHPSPRQSGTHFNSLLIEKEPSKAVGESDSIGVTWNRRYISQCY